MRAYAPSCARAHMRLPFVHRGWKMHAQRSKIEEGQKNFENVILFVLLTTFIAAVVRLHFFIFSTFLEVIFFISCGGGLRGRKKKSSGHSVYSDQYQLFSAKNSKFLYFWFLLVILVIYVILERYLLRKWGVRNSNSVSWRHVLHDYDNLFF